MPVSLSMRAYISNLLYVSEYINESLHLIICHLISDPQEGRIGLKLRKINANVGAVDILCICLKVMFCTLAKACIKLLLEKAHIKVHEEA